MAESSQKARKTLGGKGEIAHYIFKRLVLQTCKNQGLFGRGLIPLENTGKTRKCQFQACESVHWLLRYNCNGDENGVNYHTHNPAL